MGGIKMMAAAIGADLAARLPRQNKKQREGLALLVATALDVRDVNLMELAAALPPCRPAALPPCRARPSGWTCATSGSAACSPTRSSTPARGWRPLPAWTSYPPSSPRHDVHGPHSSSVAPCSCHPGRCAPARLAPGPLAAS